MRQDSGGFGTVEQGALAVAAVLVLLGAGGIWKGALGAPDVGRDFALAYVLAAGVALAVGTLAASAYRSRSQVDIDRLERAVSDLSQANSKIENVNKALMKAAEFQTHVERVAKAYDALEALLKEAADNTKAAKSSQDSIQDLSSSIRDEMKSVKKDRLRLGASTAAELMTKWEICVASVIENEDYRRSARVAYYEEIKGLLLAAGEELRPVPTLNGWEAADGNFEAVPSDRAVGDIILVRTYAYYAGGKSIGLAVGSKSSGPSERAGILPESKTPGAAHDVSAPEKVSIDGGGVLVDEKEVQS
jgi:hypothetical protein